MFRGREQSRPELGYRLLQRLGTDVADYGFVETSAKQDGRNMTMVLAPHRGAKTRARARHPEAPGAGPTPDSAPAADTEPSPN
jgi:translation initiation factor IF-3